MLMAKKAKDTQTDYTRAGMDLSRTATPLYQNTLNRIDQYQADPTAEIDKYLNKYYTNTSNESDFLRSYNRAMSDQTGRNYNATQGGYSSLNQQNYDDLQRYQNDLASRLRDYGVGQSAGLAQNYYNSLLSSAPVYQGAYKLGEDYSNIERYNNMVRQNNSFTNQLAGQMGNIGGAIGSIWGPAGAAIGKAAGNTIGGAMGTDTSGLEARLGGSKSNPYTEAAQYAQQQQDQDVLLGALGDFFGNKRGGNSASSAGKTSYVDFWNK